MISVKFENLEEMSKWTRLFSVNGPGLNFCGIFEGKKKLSFGSRKNRQPTAKSSEKISEI